MEADSRVGDHPHGVGEAEEHGGVGGGLASGRTELAGQAPTARNMTAVATMARAK